MKPSLTFWYEFASTYSYLSAMRIDREADRAGVAVRWRPFLLGPIFKAQGWTSSPFNLYPAKGRYMIRDIGRIAAERGLPFRMPPVFPASGLKAARLAIAAGESDATAEFTRAVYRAAFQDGRDIGEDEVLSACLGSAGLDPAATWTRSGADDVKSALRHHSDEAQALGIFGAPSFTTEDGELFWGDDRLETAVAWSLAHHAARD